MKNRPESMEFPCTSPTRPTKASSTTGTSLGVALSELMNQYRCAIIS